MATYYVKTDGDDSKDGLSWANAWATLDKAFTSSLDGDTVVVNDGTYTGADNRDVDAHGRDITLQSLNGPLVTILDAESSGRHLEMDSAEKSLVIDGFTFKNGYVANDGGSIYMSGSGKDDPTPTFKNCIWDNCYVDGANHEGGAIDCGFGGPEFINCIFTGCYSDADDGGACYFHEYDIDTAKRPTFRNCTFYNCSAVNGGCIYMYGDDVSMYNCIFNNCSASSSGDYFYTANGGKFLLYSCCYDNSAGYYVDSGTGGSLTADEHCITDDPLLDTDLSLQKGSPCIDTGDNSYNSETYDIIGNPRIANGG